MESKVIMVQGTTSDAGKSLLVTALCRIFSDKGLNVFPFKSQNMALNSFITPSGKEMSRAQVVQSEAARRLPDIRMNPILLKPKKDSETEVILNGKFVQKMSAIEYYDYKKILRSDITSIFEQISSENDIIIIEGAGSPAEINLNNDDIVNMGMADIANSPVILVADIDRGGVFATIYGTVKLLSEKDRKRIKGIIINKFRGDRSLLEPGLKMIEKLINIPVIGVVPFISLNIDSEDSIALDHAPTQKDLTKNIDIAVLVMDKLVNFSDFNSLNMYQDISVRYIKDIRHLGKPDILIIPGTGDIISSSKWLNKNNFPTEIKKIIEKGTRIIGICGGYYLLGQSITDTKNHTVPGMDILPFEATLLDEVKYTEFSNNNLSGYITKIADIKCKSDLPFFINEEEVRDGIVTDSLSIIGTNLNGLFENKKWTQEYINQIRKQKSLTPLDPPNNSYSEFKSKEYDKLAQHVIEHVDMDIIDQIIKEGV